MRCSWEKTPSSWMSERILDHSLMTSACLPAYCLITMASCITMNAKTSDTANATEPTPCVIAMEAVSAVTVAEWEEGIPPVVTNMCLSNLYPIITAMKGLSTCAAIQATKALIRGALCNMSLFRKSSLFTESYFICTFSSLQ